MLASRRVPRTGRPPSGNRKGRPAGERRLTSSEQVHVVSPGACNIIIIGPAGERRLSEGFGSRRKS